MLACPIRCISSRVLAPDAAAKWLPVWRRSCRCTRGSRSAADRAATHTGQLSPRETGCLPNAYSRMRTASPETRRAKPSAYSPTRAWYRRSADVEHSVPPSAPSDAIRATPVLAQGPRRDRLVAPFQAEVMAQGLTPDAVLDRIGCVIPPSHVAARLNVSETAKSTVQRVNWYFVDGEPVQIGTTYIPWAIAKGTELATGDNLGHGDLYARFEDQGYAITFTREEVMARMPTREEARDLRMPSGVPLLVVTHTGLDAGRRPFELTEFKMRADHSGLDYTMKVDD